VLLAADLHEDFIDEKSISIASVLTLQPACINGSELDTPKADRLSADRDASFCQEIFNIAMALVEPVVEPA
jgi:hypothetical protein